MRQDSSISFPISPEECRRALNVALASGGELADLYFERRVATALIYEENRVKSVQHGVSLGVGVRVVIGERSGLAYTEELTPEKLQQAARTAAAIARDNAPRVQAASVSERRHPEYYQLKRDPSSARLRDRLRYVEEANAAANAADPRVIRVQLSLVDELREIFYVNSAGVSFSDRQPMLVLRSSVIVRDGAETRTGRDSGGGRIGLEYFDDVRPAADIGREAARLALVNLDAREIEAGPMTVVLGPADSGVLLHEAVGHGLEADFNRKKLANYADRVGQRVASELCTVIDAGTFPNMRGSINIDDEGHTTGATTLIENGVLKGYINDAISAKLMYAAPTGNGRRESYAHLPMPRMTNTYMLAGRDDPAEILRTVKRGLYAKKFGGGQVDITKGDFVFSVEEGYLIEDGKLTAPLKGVTLIGNGPEVMTKIDRVGHDLKFTDGGWTCGKNGQSVPVGMGIPTVRVSEITVGGAKAV